ncbi:MFS transporter [Nocardioides sp. Kera G14]|uniref:MFS transporter n=1 Tax=Nocardioides sp. Kera G14 TaxID=2884264 RepID=UPI001D0FBA31|nr:MFS transporter [Nocardioides sp. Kera G14]UDY23521.1 MFS transporter [Nocardioides sp. Kera G14]
MALKDLLADTRPLQNPYFRRLWFAEMITVVGAQLTIVAVPAQIYADTGSTAYVGLTGVFGLVPLVIFGLYGGALSDAFDRRTIVRITSLGLIVCSALFFAQAALGNENPWLLLVLFAVQQSFFAVDSPTRAAILPRILDKEVLPAANSLHYTVFQAGAIAGPLVAGVLIPITGFPLLYLLDTLGLLAILYAVIRLPKLPVQGDVQAPGLKSVIDGLVYLKDQPILLMSFLVDIIAMVFGMPRALFPEQAHTHFHGPVDGGLAFALLFAAIPAGAVIGGVLGGWLSKVRRQGFAVVVCIIIWGLGVTVYGVADWLAPHVGGAWVVMLVIALIALAVAGAADMFSAAIRTSILQSAADDSVRGRLQGVFTVVVGGGPRISDTLHGGVAAGIGVSATAAGGGVLVVIGVTVAALVVPSFVRYTLTK